MTTVTDPPNRPEQPSPSAVEPRIIVERPGIPEAIVAAFAALGYAVSARLILLLSLVGAFSLAVMAVMSATVISLLILVAYSVLIVIPIVLLEAYGKRPSS